MLDSTHMVDHPRLRVWGEASVDRSTESQSRWKSLRSHFDGSTSANFARRIVDVAEYVRPDMTISFDPSLTLVSSPSMGRRKHILPDPTYLRLWYSAHGVTGSKRYRRRGAAAIALPAEALHIRGIGKHVRLFCFGARHATVWSRITGRRVDSLRPFIPSHGEESVEQIQHGVPIIAVGGSLNSTASTLLLAALPEIRDAGRALFGAAGFKLLVVGRGLPTQAAELLDSWPEAIVRQDVPDFPAAVSAASIFVMTADYPVGVRTRVASALKGGTPCIISKSTLRNMPELESCRAVFPVGQPIELSAAIATALRAEDRDAIRQAAAACFSENYSARAADQILEGL
jgi:hypothetical protein